MYLYFYILFLQFDDDKNGNEITKGGEKSVSEVFQWQTVKTENEGNTYLLTFYFLMLQQAIALLEVVNLVTAS